MAKPDFTVRWCKISQEYVARSNRNLDVTGHSRDPGYALAALLTKLRELEGQARTEKVGDTPQPKEKQAKKQAAKKRKPSSWTSVKGREARKKRGALAPHL